MLIGTSIFGTIGFIMVIIACVKDIQANNILWAVLDVLIFPIGIIRCIMHLLT